MSREVAVQEKPGSLAPLAESVREARQASLSPNTMRAYRVPVGSLRGLVLKARSVQPAGQSGDGGGLSRGLRDGSLAGHAEAGPHVAPPRRPGRGGEQPQPPLEIGMEVVQWCCSLSCRSA